MSRLFLISEILLEKSMLLKLLLLWSRLLLRLQRGSIQPILTYHALLITTPSARVPFTKSSDFPFINHSSTHFLRSVVLLPRHGFSHFPRNSTPESGAKPLYNKQWLQPTPSQSKEAAPAKPSNTEWKLAPSSSIAATAPVSYHPNQFSSLNSRHQY